ncbi:MAG: GTPase HflX [Desulfobacteraceae bacterium]|nr:GTPase HflX [Desulfobacteraceae bacterium]
MKRLYGNTSGLKAGHLRRLENLYRRKVTTDLIITANLCRDLTLLSHEIKRQIGLLIDRAGRIAFVLVGDAQTIFIPDLSEYRVAPGRLRGLRCVHTHLKNETLSEDDLTDLAMLRLDVMAAVTMNQNGHPELIHWAHIFPGKSDNKPYEVREPLNPHDFTINCLELIQALENEIGQLHTPFHTTPYAEHAMLISVTTMPRKAAMDSLRELKELCLSGGIMVIDTILQQRKKIDSRLLIGTGKLNELAMRAYQSGATMLIFNQELNPSQIKAITDRVELKVIDRTQLILDIFAQRAQSREGKLQVELAQLKYLLPRLVTKNTAMSRLTGGIGGRGPGETKLEINRRRVRDKINRLEKALKSVQKHRKQQRRKREQKKLPIISIIGYTNAGKSTLLNTLTQSKVLAESRLFATLDPSSRRLRFPQDMEVIITDTVGFIQDLPKELMIAFRATLEELENADILLHVIDISNPRHKDHIDSVEKILRELNLQHIPQIKTLNKIDQAGEETTSLLARRLDGIPICAKDKKSLTALINTIIDFIGSAGQSVTETE